MQDSIPPIAPGQPPVPPTPASGPATSSTPPTSRWARLKASFVEHKKPIMITGSAILTVVLLLVIVPTTRYAVLGLAFKSTVTLKVTDASTGTAVNRAVVRLGGAEAISDSKGIVTMKSVYPGKKRLVISRTAYAKLEQSVNVGLGTVNLGTKTLSATGIAINVAVRDKLTGAAVVGAELTAGDISGVTDDSGIAKLVFLPTEQGGTQTIVAEKDGFNRGQISLAVQPGSPQAEIGLVRKGSVYYLSNRSGAIHLYQSNLDGSGELMVVQGTGKETADTGVLMNSMKPEYVALLSAREGKRGAYGEPVSMLYVYGSDTKTLNKVAENVGFGTYRAWIGESLVYAAYKQTPSGGDCYDIRSYNARTKVSTNLVSSYQGGWGCVVMLSAYDNGFLYAASDGAKNGTYYATLAGKLDKQISTRPSSTVSARALNTIVTFYYQSQPDPATASSHLQINLEKLTATLVANTDGAKPSRNYVPSPADDKLAYIEERDGRSELYVAGPDGSGERKLTNLGNVSQFVAWIDSEYVVVSNSKTDENALYIASVATGKISKITDFYRANGRTYSGGSSPQY